MSIASEITRLQTAKADLKTAIESKGVEVADTDTIDTYASKVGEIQSGGGDSWYDTFWDSYLDPDTFTGAYAFAGKAWNDTTFNPDRDIMVRDGLNTFQSSGITNLKAIVERNKIKLDTSKCSAFGSTFYNSKITHIPIIDARGVSSVNNNALANTFFGCKYLVYIEKLIVNGIFSTSTFQECTALIEILVEGTIKSGNVNVKSSPLNAPSAKSFINCLANHAGTENEFLSTITFSPTTWGYLDAEGETASPNGNSWRAYINDLGWNAS